MKTRNLPILFALICAAIFTPDVLALPQNIQKDAGDLTQSFNVGTGKAITNSGGGTVAATSVPVGGVTGLGTGVGSALAVNVGTAGSPVVNGGALGTPSSGTLTNATGLPIASGVSGLGTGVATALAVNVGSAGAAVVNGGALGTPSSGVGTNLTALKGSNITGESYKITYTGTPITPLMFNLVPTPLEAGIATSPGQLTLFPTSQKFMPSCTYGEGTLLAGGSAALANNSLITLSFDDVVYGNNFGINSCPNMTSLSWPLMTKSTTININNMPALTTFSMPSYVETLNNSGFGPNIFQSLTTLSLPVYRYCGGNFNPNTMASLTTWSFPSLEIVAGNFQPGTFASLTSFSCPALTTVGGNFAPTTMGSLTTYSFALLTRIGGNYAPTTMGVLTTCSINSLQYVDGTFSIFTMGSLTTASYSGMVRYGSTITMNSGLGSLANVTLGTIGTLKEVAGATVNLSGQALTQSSVDGILKLLDSLDGTGGTTSFGTGKTVTLSGGTNASPTTTGLTTQTSAGSNFSAAGTTCTANVTGHGLTSGDIITVTGITTLTNANVTAAVVTVVNANQFTYPITSQTATGAGTATIRSTTTGNTSGFRSCQNLRLRGATVATALGF